LPTSQAATPIEAESATQTLLRQAIAQQAEQAKEGARANQAIKDQLESLRPSFVDKALPAFIGFLASLVGALVGAWVAYRLQIQRLDYDRQAARQTAGVKELSDIKQFRGRQLNEFYAPLEALLKQGLIVRNELYTRLLATNDPNVSFSKMPDPQAANKWSLGIQRKGEQMRPFRLLNDLPVLHATFPDLMGTVGETVRINKLIVKLVHEKVGLVLHKNIELSQQLGTFLAHQTVLVAMYSSVKKGGLATPPKYTTTFPRDLQRLVTKDCEKLRKELEDWETEVSGWIRQLSTQAGTPP
jgi:small-conductance mechanosensitive channel